MSKRVESAVFDHLASVFHILPQLGAPTAMKWGGLELGNVASAFSSFIRMEASELDARAAAAGIEASNLRRVQEWEHQEKLADDELKQIEKQLIVARLRKDIAERSLEVHERNIAQTEEIFSFYGEKFSNFGLYTFLSTKLQGLFREAYNNAMAMAKLAEQAYRFERDDDAIPLLQPGYWDASRAGLLAGERLAIDLDNLERRFTETHYRTHEPIQSFNLAQIDPLALAKLRQTGECTFTLPELYFDLAYPGHYRRRIRAVWVSIPCVTGPGTNVSATLWLMASKIRRNPGTTGTLGPVPVRRSVSIATSTAQNDSGVHEFSFRDERYMPFEGAGAVDSSWTLILPKAFRPFDYRTISEVTIRIAYTAEYDSDLRERVEGKNAATEGLLLKALKDQSLGRVFSLRQDFPTEFHRLLHRAAGSDVEIDIAQKHLPFFLAGRYASIDAVSARLALCLTPGAGGDLGDLKIALRPSGNTPMDTDAPSAG